MSRPRARQAPAGDLKGSRYIIVDGYVDEPASLGVPPFLSPQVRSLAGGLVSGGAREEEISYITVDQWRDLRGSEKWEGFPETTEALVLVRGCVVPGKYLRGTPVSDREARELFIESSSEINVITGSGAASGSGISAVAHSGDMGVLGESISSGGTTVERKRTEEEWETHLREGSFIVRSHPDHPSPLICEIETSEGCPRYISGGCSFCMEPSRGRVRFREPEDVISEVMRLGKEGVENIRIGGQSDLISYLSPDIGRYEVPEPEPEPVEEMMSGVKRTLQEGKGVIKALEIGMRKGIDTGIVHTDNANPAVISRYPDASGKVLKAIRDHSTSGTVMALGMESADPEVTRSNDLNSTPEEVMEAVRIINRIGGKRGSNGMPRLLPGINFLGGLAGQTETSFDHDVSLLDGIVKEELLVRRINIRKALFPDGKGGVSDRVDIMGLERSFREFRSYVREKVDRVLLSRMIPQGTVLRGVHIEARSGHTYFGRQIGSYPILVGIPHSSSIGTKADIAVTEVSSRSITGFRTPFFLKDASFRDMTALPGVGKKRAATLFRDHNRRSMDLAEIFRGEEGWVKEHLM